MSETYLAGIIIVLLTSVIFPISIVLIVSRRKMASERIRKEIILASLEKNANLDVKELVNKMNESKKLLKEKLISKLEGGLITLFIGIGLLIAACLASTVGGVRWMLFNCIMGGIVCTAVGIALLISYYIGKRMLAKEIEAEEKEKCNK
ncbi:MAG: hypothetical protein MJZ31_08640 [Bacteroidales bacterium]|nr:hypothetical protein [Bacteroidales bacterium]